MAHFIIKKILGAKVKNQVSTKKDSDLNSIIRSKMRAFRMKPNDNNQSIFHAEIFGFRVKTRFNYLCNFTLSPNI